MFSLVAGIICEYNPFHRGHEYQLKKTREALGEDTAVLCLMSGNYVQRGEPAIFDKWTRAETAIHGGADLVLELPLTAAVNAAGYFAEKAVWCLDALGCVDYLSFGSESGDLSTLQQAAEILNTPEFEVELSRQMETGVSYARARENALRTLGGEGDCLTTPNNALGVDYLRCLLKWNSPIRPVTVHRDENAPTASDLRQGIPGGHTLNNGQRAMLAVLRRLNAGDFEAAPFGSEGLWSKVMKATRREHTLEGILQSCKSKRYAYSRLKRMLLCLFLGLSEGDMDREIPYLRVLAFNDRGREVLRKAAETSKIPLISGAIPRTPEAQGYFELEARAADLYGLFAPPGALEPLERERKTPPVYVKK